VRDERAPEPPPDESEASEPTVPLIEDDGVGPARSHMAWDRGDTERKPLLTRAEPLGARGAAATWALRAGTLLLLLVVVVVIALVLASGGL
jgi:hypothetical protein